MNSVYVECYKKSRKPVWNDDEYLHGFDVRAVKFQPSSRNRVVIEFREYQDTYGKTWNELHGKESK